MDTEDDEEEAPSLISIDAEEDLEDEEVTFSPVDKMLHEQVHSFLEVGFELLFQPTD